MAPVLLAEHGVEERKGGKGGRGGAHPVRLSELPMKFLPESFIRSSPDKAHSRWRRSDEGARGPSSKGVGDERDDEGGCARPHIFQYIHRD